MSIDARVCGSAPLLRVCLGRKPSALRSGAVDRAPELLRQDQQRITNVPVCYKNFRIATALDTIR